MSIHQRRLLRVWSQRTHTGCVQVVWEASQKRKMTQPMVEQRTEHIAVDAFSTFTHVDKPPILLLASNTDLGFELNTGASVSLVGSAI